MSTLYSIFIIKLSLFVAFADEEDADNESTTIYSSCNGITEDGLYYIKPSVDLPIFAVICSNGYAMLDGSLDLSMKTIPNLLSSYDYGRFNRYYTISSLDDLSTYREWLLFADETTKFNIAPNCIQCEAGTQYGDNTVYYADSHTFCFSAAITTGCIEANTSAIYHTESCSQCDVGVFPDDDPTQLWTKCTALQLSADHSINHDHVSCVAHGLTFHPVISNVRDACTCFQAQSDRISYAIPIAQLPLVTAKVNDFKKLGFAVADNIQFDSDYEDQHNFIDQRDTNTVYLSNADFEYGTLRIIESGTYILQEDVTFNFNAPSIEAMNDDNFSPNNIDLDELYWYPTRAQSERDGAYPGLYSYSGAFTLGFFAGITIETNYVTIDLNGYTLAQNELFYFQQRFFSLIEMASQPFVPGQGPANWGAGNDVYAQYVVIKNGNLGLTSHHGIHGNNNNFVTISNVNVFGFDVAGIQCNSCTNLLISDCLIGPQNNNIPLLGRYTHSRALLPRLKQLIDDGYGGRQVTFYNHEARTVSDIIYTLIQQMDMIYNHANKQQEVFEDEAAWIAAKKLFLNPTGWMDGGSSYGLLVGGDGAQVVGIGARHGDTADVTISNVEIYGIYNQVVEKVKYTADFGATRLIFFDAIDWNAVTSETLIPSQSVYYGDAYTDITFAISHVMDSWYFMNSLYVSDSMRNFVFNGEAPPDKIFHGGCGSDIQLHSSKGAIGLRVDGTQNLNIDGLHIHDVYNWADLGNEEWCGAYEGPNVGNEDIEIQYGYTGTRAHGMVIDFVQGAINNVHIENVESYNGEANGLTVYKECDVILENINVDAIHAGTQLDGGQINELNLPNLVPRACGVDIRPNTQVIIKADSIGIVVGEDIYGFTTCYDDAEEVNGETSSRTKKRKVKKSNLAFVLADILFMAVIIVAVVGLRMNRKYLYCKKDVEIKNISECTPLLI